MSQSPQNADSSGRDPLGGDVPDFGVSNSTGQVGEPAPPVGVPTGEGGVVTGQPYLTDETAALNQYLYAPGQSSSGYDPYAPPAAGEFSSQRWEDPSRDSVASWVGVVLLMSLPVVNIVTVLVMACSSSFSRAKQNFARATLIVFGIFLGVFLLIGLTSGAMYWVVRR